MRGCRRETRSRAERAQLPCSWKRRVDKYSGSRSDRNLWHASVTSGFMGSDEIWKGSMIEAPYGGLSAGATLVSRHYQRQYDNMRSSFGYEATMTLRPALRWTPDVRAKDLRGPFRGRAAPAACAIV